MGGDAHRSPPPAAFWFLFRRGKRNSPKGRNPVRRRAESSRPTDGMVYGGRADLGSAPTVVQAKYNKTGGRAGQETRPYNISGKMQKKRTAGRRPPTQSPAKRVCVGEAERWNEQALPFWAKRGIWNPRCRGAAPTMFQADHSRTGKREGQAPPLRDGGETFPGGKSAGGHMGPPLRRSWGESEMTQKTQHPAGLLKKGHGGAQLP